MTREAGLELFEVSAADDEGEPHPATKRLPIFRLCQSALTRRGGAAVLFDETEDAFPDSTEDGFFEWGDGDERHKAWTNQILETNPPPPLWIANEIHQIDDAFLRRFSFHLKLEKPRVEIQKRTLKKRSKVSRSVMNGLEGSPTGPSVCRLIWTEQPARPVWFLRHPGRRQQAARRFWNGCSKT